MKLIEKFIGQPKVEIARSFSFKLNLGNYENVDFFCSQKTETKRKEAEKVSENLYLFCKKEVLKSVNAFQKLKKEHKESYLDMKWHRDVSEESQKVDYQAAEEEKENLIK